jgi:hypothetical protein
MAQYRKKPIVIEAFRYRLDVMPQWFYDVVGAGTVTVNATSCTIATLEGDMIAGSGDWIIKGVKGDLYPCKPDIFTMTYEAV